MFLWDLVFLPDTATQTRVMSFVVLLSMIFGDGNCISGDVEAACRGVYLLNEETLIRCCSRTDLMNYVTDCIDQDDPSELKFSVCNLTKCIAEKFKIEVGDTVDLNEIAQVLREQDDADNSMVDLNNALRKYCIEGDFKNFPGDPNCPLSQFINCLIFAYRMTCPIIIPDQKCVKIQQNVTICKPHQDEYVESLKNKSNQ